jgi:hypothetical protein
MKTLVVIKCHGAENGKLIARDGITLFGDAD